MNCHSQIWADSPTARAGARELAHAASRSRWTRVHDLPDFVYFNHSIHVEQGRRLRDLPRPHRPDAAHAGRPRSLHDGVVPRLPPQPGALRAAARSEVFNMDWEPPTADRPRARAATRPRVDGDTAPSSAHRRRAAASAIADLDLDAVRAELRRRAAAASTGGASRSWPARPGVRRAAARASSRARRRACATPSIAGAFLQLMGASLALAGLSGLHAPAGRDRSCRTSRRPRRSSPASRSSSPPRCRSAASATGCWSRATWAGRPRSRATRASRRASARPTPSRRPRCSTLYDPDRSQVVTHARRDPPWERVRRGACARRSRRSAPSGGAGLRILTETVTRRRWRRSCASCSREFPQAHWHQYEPLARDSARAGARIAFGADVDVLYASTDADVILSLDADFLACGPGSRALRCATSSRRRRRAAARR